MVNKEFFFKGFKSILAPDSPALALGCCLNKNNRKHARI